MLTLLTCLAVAQIDVTSMLEKGPMVLVEEGTGGKFARASGVVLVNAAPEVVWAIVKAQDQFKTFVPKVVESTMKPSGTDFEVGFTVEVPGIDSSYRIRYTVDEAARTMDGAWAGGDLKGSRWHWRIEGAPGGKTLLTHTLACKNFSGLAQTFEDDQQTLTVGVNVSAVLAATKAVKKKAETAK